MNNPSEIEPLPFSLREKLEDLKQKLLAQNPGYKDALNFIHAETQKHPEYVFALSDEEMQVIVSGYSRFAKIEIDVGKMTKKQAAELSEDDI